MTILNEVDKPGSDVDQYVNQLDSFLLNKIEQTTHLRNR
jgi:hypothetical protein